MTGIKDLYIAAENWSKDDWDYEDDNTDVIVTMDDGSKYVATFFTFKNIESLRQKNHKTGECINGKYFWASDMILVDSCSRNSIEEIIQHLITSEEFYNIFDKVKI